MGGTIHAQFSCHAESYIYHNGFFMTLFATLRRQQSSALIPFFDILQVAKAKAVARVEKDQRGVVEARTAGREKEARAKVAKEREEAREREEPTREEPRSSSSPTGMRASSSPRARKTPS